jgi:hypothetical protein
MELSGEISFALSNLEEARKKSNSTKFTTQVVIALMSGSLAIYLLTTGSLIAMIIEVIVSIVGAASASKYFNGKVNNAFKRQVLPILLTEIDPSLCYDVTGFVSEKEFKTSSLFSGADRYSGKDLVQGSVGSTRVCFSFVHAEEEYESRSTDSDGKSRTTTEFRTIFEGLFFVADFNKHFFGRTLIKPKAVNFLSKLFGSHVALEDPEFNKFFTVTSTDQVEARYIMTPALMERLKSLRAKTGTFSASFVGGNLFMAVEMKSNAFEPDLSKSLVNGEQVQEILTNLRGVTTIVDDLGLNVRIWTKT